MPDAPKSDTPAQAPATPATPASPAPTPTPAVPAAPPVPASPDAPVDLTKTWQEMLAEAPPAPSPTNQQTPGLPVTGTDPALSTSTPATPPILPTAPPAAAPTNGEVKPAPVETAPVEGPVETDPSDIDFDKLGEPLPDEDSLIERLRVEEERRVNAQRKIGQQGEELHALRQEIAELRAAVQRPQPSPLTAPTELPLSKEDLVARLLEDPVTTIATIVASTGLTPETIRSQVAQVLEEQRSAYLEEQRRMAPAVAGNVGFQLFAARFADQVGENQSAWQESEDGKAVIRVISSDPDRQAALASYLAGGDEQGVARVLGKAYRDHLKGRKAVAAKKAAVAEIRRVESSKTSAIPTSQSPVLTPSHKTFDQMSYRDILALGTD